MTKVKYVIAAGILSVLIVGGVLIAWKMDVFSSGKEKIPIKRNSQHHVGTEHSETAQNALLCEKIENSNSKPSSTSGSNNSASSTTTTNSVDDSTKSENLNPNPGRGSVAERPPSTERISIEISTSDHPNFITLSSCVKSSFCEAHIQFLKQIRKFLQDGSSLDTAFEKAKSLYSSSVNDALIQAVYSSSDAKTAALVIFSVDAFEKDFKGSLRKMVPPDSNPYIPKLYELFTSRYKLGERIHEMKLLRFDNFSQECTGFINAFYRGRKAWFEEPLREIFIDFLVKKVTPKTDILPWWRLFGISSNGERTLFEEDSFYSPEFITDTISALKFSFHPKVNTAISNWLARDSANRVQLEAEYKVLSPKQLFGLTTTLSEAIEAYFTPSPVFPIEKAVIDTVPRKIDFEGGCYASSYYQSMANFFPLVRDLPQWSHKGNKQQVISEQKNIMSELATASDEPVKVLSQMSHALPLSTGGGHAIQLVDEFARRFGADGLAANKLRGFAKVTKDKVQYFPPYSYFVLTPGMPELENLIMIGQLFIAFLSADKIHEDTKDDHFYQIFELPMHLELKVVGSEKKKRFELYSFNMCIKMDTPHAISYVKRANGQWWLCNDLRSGNEKVNIDQLPITAAFQKAQPLKQRPIFAFYLRVE